MKLRVIKNGLYKGYVLAWWSRESGNSQVISPHSSEAFYASCNFNEDDFEVVEFEPVKAVASVHDWELAPSFTAPTRQASCEKACLINQKRRDNAVKRMKALRGEKESLERALEEAFYQLDHILWALGARLLDTSTPAGLEQLKQQLERAVDMVLP